MNPIVSSTALVLVVVAFFSTEESDAAGTPAVPKDQYWPSELGPRFNGEDVRTFVHFATYFQNSKLAELESKMQGGNVFVALRGFAGSKVGDYFRTLLRMWAKFAPEDRLKHKPEMFKNIDSLKIPENWKNGFKGMFEHVDALQGMIASSATLPPTSPTTPALEATTPSPAGPPQAIH